MAKIELPENRYREAYMFLQPTRPVLVTTLDEDGATHVAPFSWVTPLSTDPPIVGLALLTKQRKQHTLENIERLPEFAINVPGLELAEQLVLCSYKVKPCVKKLKLAGFNAVPAGKIKPQLIEECRSHLECKVLSMQETGDHTLVIGEIIHVTYQEKAYTASLVLNLNEFRPCLHLDNYSSESGQAHIFIVPGGLSVAEVPYTER